MNGYGYLDLEEACNLYSSFNELSCPHKQAFRDKLLDPDHGLPMYVITEPISCNVFVVLKNGSGMEKFLVNFINVLTSDTSYEREGHAIDKDTLAILLKSMDTEYDRNDYRYYRILFEDTHCTREIEFLISNNKIALLL